jgi:hypothetical protein
MPVDRHIARLFFAALLALVALQPPLRADDKCRNQRGDIFYLNDTPTAACGKGIVTGTLAGVVTGCILDVQPRPNGGLHVIATNTFFPSRGGSFVVNGEAELTATSTPNVYRVDYRFSITSGTGIYEGATGSFRSLATVDFNVGSYIGNYRGRICFVGEAPEGDGDEEEGD